MVWVLISLSALCLFQWLRMVERRSVRSGAGVRGLSGGGVLGGNRRASLLVSMSLTLYLLAGWLVILPGSHTRAGRYAVDALAGVGCALAIWFLATFSRGRRPHVMAPLSMRPITGNRPLPSPREGDVVMTDSDLGLRAGENLVGSYFANHVQTPEQGYGGRLYITSERLVFIPFDSSAGRGGARYETELSQVTRADVAPRAWGARGGAWRRRLRVSTSVGDAQYFVVWLPRKLAATVNDLLLSVPSA